MNNVDYDPKKFDRDAYGNLYPKRSKKEKPVDGKMKLAKHKCKGK